VASGAGVTLLPRIAVEAEAGRAGLRARAFTDPAPGRTLVLAHRRGSAVEPAVRAIAEAIRRGTPPARVR
jgi:LysR family hydrogen peroxide-inducible transcriptional activator